MLDATEYLDIKDNIPFWRDLSTEQVEYMCNAMTKKKIVKGDLLHRGELDCVGMIYVKSGRIRIFVTSEEGREITLYCLAKNDICVLSAACVLQNIDFDIFIEADSDCEIIQINSQQFSRLVEENIKVELFCYKLASKRFSDIMCAMKQILFKSFDKRLAAFLIENSVKQKSPDINMTQDQIAKYLGSAREVVSRMLKLFVEKGYISLYRGGVHIIDLKGLKSIIE